MVLTIGRSDVECESFRVKGAYSSTIARLFSLPMAVESKEPLTLEVTVRGNTFKPYKASRRVYWNKKMVGFFVLSSVSQEWDSDKYRTRLELKQCERSESPDDDIPAYKWRFDLQALAEGLPETDGAKIAAGRTIEPFADSWKVGSDAVQTDTGDNITPAVLPVSQGGTGADKSEIALINLGGIPNISKGIPFGVAPLGADGKVPAFYLPAGSGGGSVTFPITVAQGGTDALDASTARANLGVPSILDLTTGLGAKVDTTTYTAGLALKADLTALTAGLALKVDTTTYTAGLALKADASAVASALALKADTSAVATALGLKVDTTTYTAGLALKADTTALTAGLALKVDTTTYTTGLGLKLDASARNAASGVAGLDASSLIAVAQIPLSLQFILQPRSSAAIIDANSLTINHASIKWLDSAAHTNLPSGITSGSLLQYDPLFGVSGSTGLYKQQIFNNYSNRMWDRYESNGTWSAWNERTYLNRAQTFSALQEFAAAATFKAGGIPAVTTTLIQAGVDAGGQPRLWLVNASATTGNRLKSITIASNGNVQIRHHADDGTDGNVLENTASGNTLTNGTFRPCSGTTNFTGASFVPGAIYFRSDITGDSGTGALTYSDGTIWRRLNGLPVTVADPGLLKAVVTGTTSASQGGTVSVAHGLTAAKIRSVNGVIYYATGQTVPINSRQSAYASIYATDATNFSLTNEAANSAGILSKTFYATIEYTN